MIFFIASCVEDGVWTRSDCLALWALVAGVIGIVVAIYTLHRGNQNSSVASMIPLNAEIRDTYDRYIESFSSAPFHTPAELDLLELEVATRLEKLMNVLEIAAAIMVERTLSGVSRVLMRAYLQRILEDLLADDYTSHHVSQLLQDEQTYLYIRLFLNRKSKLSVVLPPQWYASPDQPLWQKMRDRISQRTRRS